MTIRAGTPNCLGGAPGLEPGTTMRLSTSFHVELLSCAQDLNHPMLQDETLEAEIELTQAADTTGSVLMEIDGATDEEIPEDNAQEEQQQEQGNQDGQDQNNEENQEQEQGNQDDQDQNNEENQDGNSGDDKDNKKDKAEDDKEENNEENEDTEDENDKHGKRHKKKHTRHIQKNHKRK